MNNDQTTAQVLDLMLRDRHLPRNQWVFVSAPPGSGKTELVALVATTAAACGLRVGIACPRAWQTFDLMRRMLQAYPDQAVRLWVGRDRPVPAELREQAHGAATDPYAFGSGDGTPIDVATVAKFTFLPPARAPHFDLLICDESFLVTFADAIPLFLMADRFLLVGDPGQLPPLVLIDSESFAGARFRLHSPAAAELSRHLPEAPHLALSSTYRLPPDTVALIQPALYPELPFRASGTADRRLSVSRPARAHDAVDRALDAMAAGMSLLCLMLPPRTSVPGPGDPDVVALMASVVERMLERGMAPVGGPPFHPRDIGCIDPHVASGAALRRELGRRGIPVDEVMVETPEVCQGRQRPVMVVQYPIRGDLISPFELDPGRIAVSLTRHEYACVLVARAGVDESMWRQVHDSGARPLGERDIVWQGIQSHVRLWRGLRQQGRVMDA